MRYGREYRNTTPVIKAEGKWGKLGADSRAGWVAYVRGKVMLVKFFPVYPGATYSDGGNTVEVYWDEKVAELEPLSPEIRLDPGQEYVFPEKWELVRLPHPVKTAEQARESVRTLPRNPFK